MKLFMCILYTYEYCACIIHVHIMHYVFVQIIISTNHILFLFYADSLELTMVALEAINRLFSYRAVIKSISSRLNATAILYVKKTLIRVKSKLISLVK